jgi:hypothetical protein
MIGKVSQCYIIAFSSNNFISILFSSSTVSPNDYFHSKSKSNNNMNKKMKHKKILLGKPITKGKEQKMSLQELKALSRQIRPLNNNSNKEGKDDNIVLMSRNLRFNLFKAKSKMMDSLKNSNIPKDLEVYECLNNDQNAATIQLRLVTNESGSVSIVAPPPPPPLFDNDSTSSSSASSTISSFDDEDEDDYMPLYHHHQQDTSFMNMELIFQSPHWQPTKTMSSYNQSDVTEDQINSWLQRGGFGDHMSPITMATDQELAGKYKSL